MSREITISVVEEQGTGLKGDLDAQLTSLVLDAVTSTLSGWPAVPASTVFGWIRFSAYARTSEGPVGSPGRLLAAMAEPRQHHLRLGPVRRLAREMADIQSLDRPWPQPLSRPPPWQILPSEE